MGISPEELSFDINKYRELLKRDILFEHIAGTEKEEILFTEDYLVNLEEKTWYSTNEIAEWFGVSDGQLRYYVKPFHEYIFSEDNPSLSTAYRINIEGVLRLRMIIMLKDQHKLQGLKKLLGVGEVTKLQFSNSSRTPAIPGSDDISEKVEKLEGQLAEMSILFQQVLQTGVFQIQKGENGTEISIREEFISDKLKVLQPPVDIDAQYKEIEEKVAKENRVFKQQVEETIVKERKLDVAIRMKEAQIENEVIASLRAEATKKWAEQSKYGFLAKIMKQEEIAAERESFVSEYFGKHLNERLKNAFNQYHESDKES